MALAGGKGIVHFRSGLVGPSGQRYQTFFFRVFLLLAIQRRYGIKAKPMDEPLLHMATRGKSMMQLRILVCGPLRHGSDLDKKEEANKYFPRKAYKSLKN